MNPTLRGLLTLVGRVFLCTIFFMSAVGNKIPNFHGVVEIMKSAGIPAPQVLLPGAITFLVVGSISVVLGYQARLGAVLLLVFLVLATYFFHNFWALEPPQAELQLIQFMKKSDQHKDTPIVLISTQGSERDRDRGMQLGASEFLAKPFTLETLREVAGRLLARPRRSDHG